MSALKVKALYSIRELAGMAGIPERRLREWIAKEQMSVVRPGRSGKSAIMVPLHSFRDAFPAVWEAICLSRRLLPGKCQACGGDVKP